MYESAPWRTELRKHAVTIRDAGKWPCEQRVPFELERSLFYSALVLRKLIEDRKVTDAFASKSLDVISYRSKSPEKSSIWRNMPSSVEFDWNKPEATSVGIKELCSQIIHFFAFHWSVEDDGAPQGAIVCSYRKQDERGFLIEFNVWSELLLEAADSWPTSIIRSKVDGHKVK
jgi:hypothetical protein